jgi:hypothetical protein
LYLQARRSLSRLANCLRDITTQISPVSVNPIFGTAVVGGYGYSMALLIEIGIIQILLRIDAPPRPERYKQMDVIRIVKVIRTTRKEGIAK